MGSVNKVILVGRLGSDPELKYTPSNKAVCNFSVATSEQWKDKSGAKQEKTEWHRIVAWGELGELCSKYLAKGREAYLEGRLQTRTYDKDGQKHYATEVVADKVVFLGGGKASDSSEAKTPSARTKHREEAAPESDDGGGDDIPF